MVNRFEVNTSARVLLEKKNHVQQNIWSVINQEGLRKGLGMPAFEARF